MTRVPRDSQSLRAAEETATDAEPPAQMAHGATARPSAKAGTVKVKRPTRPDDEADWKRHPNERLRAGFAAGAEAEWRMRTGRPMTTEELERVLGRYPGDV